MKNLLPLIFLALAVCACSPDFDPASLESALNDGKTLTRLYTAAPGKLRYLLAREGIEVTGSHQRLGFVDVYTTLQERDRLVVQYADRIRTIGHLSTRQPLALSDYTDPTEMSAFLDQVEADYPDIAMKVTIEDTLFEGQSIYAMKISDNVTVDEDEPTYLMDGQIHAREVMTAEVQMDAIDWLTSNYGSDADATRWVDEMEIWIVPIVNPDGAAYVHAGHPMWRVNRNPACGVDLNRNFSWSYRQCWGSSNQCGAEDYHGTGPNSEPEAQAIDALMADLRPMYYINYHSYGEWIVWPGGCGRVDEHELFLNVATKLNNLVLTDDGQTGHWTIGNVPEAMGYSAPGGADDQAYGAHGAVSFTVELNSTDFQPDYNTWRDLTALRQRDAWGFLLERTLSGPALTGHTYDAATSDPVVATYQFANHPFTSDQVSLQTDAAGRFGRAVLPNSDHLVIFTAVGYLPESRQVHVDASPEDLDVPMTPGMNQAPSADAGGDQLVNEGDQVRLDAGGSSDPEGNTLLYRWTQTTGPAVHLRDELTATPAFFAPGVDQETSLTFDLIVSDGELESTDAVTVTVQDLWDESFDYPSTDTPKNIPDYNPTGITSTIHVAEDRLILGVSAEVDITHTWIGDLRITLTSPGGTEVVLHDFEGEDQQNLHEIYQPSEFIGESSGGAWVLFILDAGPNDVGRLNYWTLTLDLAGDPPCTTEADCDLPQVQTHACNQGRCEIVSCEPGWSDCNDYRLDGCETATDADLHNCGGCDLVCATPPRATPACVAGVCTVGSCVDPFGDCDGGFENGCEANLESDPAHCGSCGTACDFANAGGLCQAGTCAMGACDSPFGDCDADPQNGCEINLDDDPQHCGACEHACALPGGSSSCQQGECVLAGCNPDLGDCNQNPQDGCETDLQTSTSNCGSCGNACPAGSQCESGVCQEVEDNEPPPDDGCGCGHSPGSTPVLLLTLTAFLAVRRRRRIK